MANSKSEVLQIRIDAELLKRYKSFAHAQGLHVSIALRQYMKRQCDDFEAHHARQKAQQERDLNKR